MLEKSLGKSAHLSSLSKSPGGFAYQRHKTQETALYKIIEQNLPSFQSHLSNADISLPSFVHNEFGKYLRCGMLMHGFLRVKCSGCRFEHLVAFSCKLRGFCPSCGARRMVETSAHLVDRNAEPQSYLQYHYGNGFSVFPSHYDYSLPANLTHLADASLLLSEP
jgi:ribosomal protein S27E